MKHKQIKFFSMEISPLNIVVAFTVFYIVLCFGLYIFQRKILYLPSGNMGAPSEYGFTKVHELKLKTKDGINITAWHLFPKDDGNETILYFHGNAGHMADRSDKFRSFLNQGFNVFAVSYRGYGTSEGSPSEEGLYNDARAAIEYLQNNEVSLSNIVLFGESLGSGVATQLATEYQVKLLVLEAPYTSVVRRAAELYPFIPVKFLLKDKFYSLDKINNVKSPLLLIHGELDNVIPIKHGKELFEAANEPKKAVYYPDIGHTDFNPDQLASEIRKFADNFL